MLEWCSEVLHCDVMYVPSSVQAELPNLQELLFVGRCYTAVQCTAVIQLSRGVPTGPLSV